MNKAVSADTLAMMHSLRKEEEILKVAVCDDNKVMLEYISRKVDENFTTYDIPHKISSFLSGTNFIEQHRRTPFDVVFLDIKMPDIDGFEVAKQVRRVSEKTYIIFITTESGLVYDSFDYHPFYFIPKGKTEILNAKLKSVIWKLVEQIRDNYTICFNLPHGEKKYVKTGDIIYAASKSNYIDIVCKAETIHIRRKLDEILDELPAKSFARINNRIVVNMGTVCRVDNTRMKAVLFNDTELNISRRYKAEFSDKYNIFMRNYS